MRISLAWTARDVRATYAFFVDELACFRLGGYRFYGTSTLDEIIATGDLFLESIDTPQLELMVRAVPDMPPPSEDDALILETRDVAGLFQRLRASALPSGARVLSDQLLDTPHGEAFWVADPSGHRIHFLPVWRPAGSAPSIAS